LLVEVFVGGKDIGAENHEAIAMELVAAGFTDQTNDARAAALIGGRSVLGFDPDLFHAILGNLHRRDDGGDIVFGNAQRTSVEHIVNRSLDGAVDGIRRDIDSRAST
jgi:hypothetical protein